MSEGNSLNSYADKLISQIIEQIGYQTNSSSFLKGAMIHSVNLNGTVNVVIPPDINKVFNNISNLTPFILKTGDSVEIMVKDGNYSNCWVAAKHGATYSNGGLTESNGYYTGEVG